MLKRITIYNAKYLSHIERYKIESGVAKGVMDVMPIAINVGLELNEIYCMPQKKHHPRNVIILKLQNIPLKYVQ